MYGNANVKFRCMKYCTRHLSPSVLLLRFQSDYFIFLKHLQESMKESEVLVRVAIPSDRIEQGAS